MLTAPLSVGSMISVQGTSYRIYGTYMVKCRLFVSTGAISISYQDYRLYGTCKIKRFAMLIGLRNHAELAASFFNNCSIKDTVAEQTYIFHSFTEENIFRTWQ